MWLFNCKTHQLKQFSSRTPDYVILSHRWGSEEVTFDEVRTGIAVNRKGYLKILGTCDQATRDGYEWIWIDTCCIDKTSSSELQESLNSMLMWYKNANFCIAYLDDVPDETAGWTDTFGKSAWFTRGWTLQELIGPQYVEFYAADWSPIGTKLQRKEEISRITGIQVGVLDLSRKPSCAAQIISWASRRETSREEDMSYALMGLLDVNIPLLYGEGKYRAFQRLQQEVLNRFEDHTLFLWRVSERRSFRNEQDQTTMSPLSPRRYQRVGLLAPGPEDFDIPEGLYSSLLKRQPDSYRYVGTKSHPVVGDPITMTGDLGIHISLWMLDLNTIKQDRNRSSLQWDPLESFRDGVTHAAILNVQLADFPLTKICIPFLSSNKEGTVLERPIDNSNYGIGAAPIDVSHLEEAAQFRRVFVKQTMERFERDSKIDSYIVKVKETPFKLSGLDSPNSNIEVAPEGHLITKLFYTHSNEGERPLQIMLFLTHPETKSWAVGIELGYFDEGVPSCRLIANPVDKETWQSIGRTDEQANDWTAFQDPSEEPRFPVHQDRISCDLGDGFVARLALRRLPSPSQSDQGLVQIRAALSLELQLLKDGVVMSPPMGSWDQKKFWGQLEDILNYDMFRLPIDYQLSHFTEPAEFHIDELITRATR